MYKNVCFERLYLYEISFLYFLLNVLLVRCVRILRSKKFAEDRKEKNKINKNNFRKCRSSQRYLTGSWNCTCLKETYWHQKETRSRSATTCWTGETYFSPVAGGKTMFPLSGMLAHPFTGSRRLCWQQSIYQKHQIDLSLTTKNTEFGCIN